MEREIYLLLCAVTIVQVIIFGLRGEQGCFMRVSILSVVLKLALAPLEVEAKRTSFPLELSVFKGSRKVQFTMMMV